MSIELNKPYKINTTKHKRYDAHYHIHSAKALVIPRRSLGNESLSEIRWQDTDGGFHFVDNVVFLNENLAPVNVFVDTGLMDIWEHYHSEEGGSR